MNVTARQTSRTTITTRNTVRRCLSVTAVAAAATTMGIVAPAQASTESRQEDVRTRERETYASPRETYASPVVTHEPRGPRRMGGQFELFLGATACMPGESRCSIDRDDGDGRTWPSFGAGATFGWRASPWLLIGAAYRYGMFHPDYDFVAARDYDVAHQHGVYALFRPIIPAGRVDIGLDIGPGYSGQFFERGGGDRDFSHGFSFIFGPTIDVFITDRFFLGAKVDFLLNSHRQVCSSVGDQTTCTSPRRDDIAPVHQVIYGIHLGGTFGG